MGDNVSSINKQSFQQKLQYVQRTEDPNFGPVDIFRFKEPPYEYIMQYEKTFIHGDPRIDKQISFMRQLQKKQHKNISKIHVAQLRQQNHMCIKDIKMGTFCTYYNFTLKQAIDKKKYRQSRFTESQISYILSCLLDIAKYLKGQSISLGDYRTDKIFLSPQGHVKIYLLQIEKDNKHIAYYKALTQKSLIQQYILSPEELLFLQQMQAQPHLDIYKADVFCIGMIILELITLDKAKFYYNEDKSGLKMGRVNFVLNSFSREYSSQFLDLLRYCLIEDPRERYTIEQAYNCIENIRKKATNMSYCIRLHDDDNQSRKLKAAVSVKSQYILSGIQKRLTPGLISTLSSSTSSGFNSKYSAYAQSDSISRSGK